MPKAKKQTAKKHTAPAPPAIPPAAYKIREFCAAYRMSPAKFYELKEAGKAPRIIRDGTWQIITIEDAQAWARRDDAASNVVTLPPAAE